MNTKFAIAICFLASIILVFFAENQDAANINCASKRDELNDGLKQIRIKRNGTKLPKKEK